MAKTAAAKTPADDAADAASKKYMAAREAHEKSPNDKTQKALDTAKAERDAALKVQARERFQRVGGGRASQIIGAIEAFGKLNNTRSYEYSEADLSKLESAINAEMTKAFSALRNAKNKQPGTVAAKPGFTF